jgi:hypothetical protein
VAQQEAVLAPMVKKDLLEQLIQAVVVVVVQITRVLVAVVVQA